ncbi:MAG: hypothetical protein MUP81_02510 [Dehalococcoidia bacterium]|nr:hypothetical protein [Dehalococcoidia bacterium]
MNISVVVVTYRRFGQLDSILAAWLKETPDVWLCDCSPGGFKVDLPVNIIRATPDPGNRIRHAVALLTDGDLVIKSDDDVMPQAGIGADFVKYMATLGPAILGIHGRVFRGPDYYHDTTICIATNITQPQAVDFAGIMTCAPREFLPMDLRGCGSEIEDLFWQMEQYPKTKKYVIATNKFHLLPESQGQDRLCLKPESRAIRQRYYERLYVRHYKARVL